MARREIPRELSIYINDKQVINSFAGISRAITQTTGEMNNLNRNSATYNEDLNRLSGELSQLTTRQTEFRNEIRGTSEAMDDGTGSFAKFKDGLLSGDFKSAKEGLAGIKNEMVNLVKSSIAFIATPVGAAIAVLAGIVVGTKALFDFNKELEVSNKTLRSFGVAAEELTKTRSAIQATAETYEKEFDEIAEKANSLAKSYGISMLEANEIIAKGLAEGGAQNKEFLDSIGEYDEFFAKAGYSAQEFIDIINSGSSLGIYADKLPDALKEADLSLKEQTKATRDALENAFGGAFSDQLLAKVASGTITTKEALQEIAKESAKTQLSQQQQAQLTADIFKGAGEDAGGALKILQAVGGTVKTEMTAAAKASDDLRVANEKLNNAQAELFEIEGFGGMWDVIKAQATDALAEIIIYLSDLKKDIQPLIDIVGVILVIAFEQFKATVVTVFNIVGFAVKVFFDYLKFGFDLIKKIITGDFKGAFKLFGDYFLNLGKTIEKFFGKIQNTVLSSIQGIVRSIAPLLEAIGLDVDAIQKKLESWKVKKVTDENKPTENTKPKKTAEELAEEQRLLAEALAKQKALRDAARQKEEEARKKAAEKKRAEEEKAAKLELDRMLALAKAKADLAKAELNFFIANERSKLDSTKQLTPQIIAEETSRLERILDKQLTAMANERLAQVEKAEADAKSAEELAIVKYTIDLEYETQRQNLQLEFQQTTDALKKEYEAEQKVLAAEQLQADNELALMEADNSFEAGKIKQQQDYQSQLAGYKKLLDDKKITESEYIRFKDAAEKQQAEIDRQREINKVNASLNAFGQLAGALGELFGQSKELAITQAGINGALAITSILSAPSMGNPILDAAVKAVQIAATVVSVAAQVKQITKAKAPKKPKFYYGGFTGDNAIGYDQYGKIVGDVHDNEYVIPKAMTQSPRYANTIAWLEAERTGKSSRKFAEGGASSSNMIPELVMNENDAEMKGLLRALLYRLDNPITPNLIFGYDQAKAVEDLNSERVASEQNATVNE